MGAKRRSRLFAVLIAVVMIATSAVGVFAADGSPYKGAVSPGSVQTKSASSASVSWTGVNDAESYNVYVNGELVAKGVMGTSYDLSSLKGKTHYTVEVAAVNKSGNEGKKVVIGKVCTNKKLKKVTAKRAGKKSIKVSWKKKGKVSGYKIAIYKNGKYWKTVSAGKNAKSKTIKKLKSGAKYKFVVTALCSEGCNCVQKSSKTVKAK